MTRGGCERAALAATTWLWSAAFCALAQAQTPAVPATNRRGDMPVEFDIPAQPMAAALNAWAVQANAQMFVDPGPIAHLIAPPIKGALTPRQALRALLARSNLQVSQGADGVFVIRMRAITAVAPTAPAPEPAAPSAAPAPAAPLPLTARASAGPWLLGLAADFAQDHAGATGGASVTLDGEYFISDHFAAALAMTAPRRHSFEIPAEMNATAYRASALLQPSALTLRYYVAPESRVDPYLGAGLNVTAIYGASGVAGLDRVTVGPTVAAGVAVTLSPHWMLNAGVSWAQVRPGPEVSIDPVQFDLGFIYRFGAIRSFP